MLPTNVYSFMKKMVSNTESNVSSGGNVSSGQFVLSSAGSPSTPTGAMDRLRQTLQQAQESVSNRLTSASSSSSTKPQVNIILTQPPNYSQQQQPETPTNVPTPTSELTKEIIELPRPGSAGRCRVCVKAMKPDEFFRECTECELRVCDDCASYSATADGNEVSWRCSVCRRKGVAIIARRVQPGIEQSEALEGVGFETQVRRSPDARSRLMAGGRADSETEVLLLAPKPSDVRRHSDVPLRDIAKFQAQSGVISNATSSTDLGQTLGVAGSVKAKSSTELMPRKGSTGAPVPAQQDTTVTKDQLLMSSKKSGGGGSGSGVPTTKTKQGQVKRQRSYERGASEGTLNLPGNNRGRRASCDLRSIDPNDLNLNNNSISKAGAPPAGGGAQHTSASSKSDKHSSAAHSHTHSASARGSTAGLESSSTKGHGHGHSSQSHGHGRDGKNVSSGTGNSGDGSNLVIRNDSRRRSVQIYNSTSKQSPSPRSCTSLDTSGDELIKNPSSLPHSKSPVPPSCGGDSHSGNHMKRQGSSTDGEAIKIVIDDVDSTSGRKDNKSSMSSCNSSSGGTPGGPNKGQPMTDQPDLRTRLVRLRRDPQDKGYQTRGFGIRVVGGCSSSQSSNPGNLRARVARVTPGSGADFAGIRRGDIVLSWNGIRLTNLTFEEVCKVMDASGDTAELNIASYDNDALMSSSVPENEISGGVTVTPPSVGIGEWDESSGTSGIGTSCTITTSNDHSTDSSSLGLNSNELGSSPSNRRKLPRLPGEGRIQLRLFHDEIHNTLEIAVVNIAFGQEDCSTLDLNDILITLRISDKIATTRWNQCTLFTKVSPEDLFDSWLVMELVRGPDFLGECHVDMGRVSLDDRPVWFPFSNKGTSSHRGSISQIVTNSPGGMTPSARELARRLRMRGLGAGSQSQSEEQDDSSGQSSPCASSLLRPEVAWEVLGTLGPPGTVLTCRSAPTSRRGSAQSDRGAIGVGEDGQNEGGRGSLPSTPQMPRSLPPSRRGSFAVAVEAIINNSRRGSVAFQQRLLPDTFGRQLPEVPDSIVDPSMLRNRRGSSWNPREVPGFDRRSQFERTDSLRTITQPPPRRVSADFRDFRGDPRNQQRKSCEPDDSWRHQAASQQQQQQQQQHWGQ